VSLLNDNPDNTQISAAIYGCQGLTLLAEEDAFFRQTQPFGFILFARNIETPDQIRKLVQDLRATVGRNDAPVLIDQEGGRVQRLRPPLWRQAPSALTLARLGGDKAEQAVELNARLIARELADLGITVDCAPVADVAFPETHDVIGDRAYSADPKIVGSLCKAVCRGLRAEGVHPVIKHIPGHGRAICDSHLELPRVEASANALEAIDFKPFSALADEDWAMTAHIVYAAFDDKAPATFSEHMIANIIRKDIGFSGLLMSDDLSMKALDGDFTQRAERALAAGCDMVLHCNGDMVEMQAVAKGVSALSKQAWQRFVCAENRRLNAAKMAPQVGTAQEMTDRLNAML